MKKILLVVGLAFGCSSVYAQVTQIGVGNTNMINAAGLTNPSSNLELIQLYGNTAEGTMGPDLLSPGGQVTARIRQRNIGATAPGLYNFIRIMQEGAGHEIYSDQAGYNNRAAITQSAAGNNATAQTSQFGYNNGIVLRQIGGADYTATIRQGQVIPGGTFGTPFPSTNPALSNTIKNTATLTQSGSAGSADIVQAGSSSRFTGVQNGGTPLAPNSIVIRQDNLSAIDLNQDGEGNNITIRQNGWQYARTTQAAGTVRNNIEINQGDNRLQDTKNTAVVTQNMGDSNQATVNQNTSQSEKNDTRIVQNGSRREVGNNSEILVNQEGKSSRTILTQTETSRGSVIDVLQTNAEVFKGSYAEVTQGGEDNEFDVEQDGNLQVVMGTQEGEDNTTTIDQEGQKNMATVNQHGSDNVIDIEQENEPSSPIGNKATANQADGTSDSNITIDQSVGTDGDGNVAVVNQTRGDGNTTTIEQDALNVATVTQSGSEYENAPATGSNVDIDQSESTSGVATVVQQAGTFGNEVLIEQDEVGNTATVTQTSGRLNSTDIFQNDNGNTATVTQGGNEDGAGGGATPNEIDIDQEGKNAVATVTQMNDTNGSIVDIDQDDSDIAEVMQANGENLEVTIEQSGANLGMGNVARTSQQGEDNTIDIDQDGNMNVVGGSIAGGGMAMQAGIDNVAELDQDGSNNKIAMNQNGTENLIDIDQQTQNIGGNGNEATATQGVNSEDSQILINQAVDNSGGNKATVNQTQGDRNLTQIVQLMDNTATVTQSGTEAEATNTPSTVQIDQSLSTGGTATVNQLQGTLGNAVVIGQAEVGNIATVNQTNGIFNQTAIGQAGTNNEATVTQSGSWDLIGIPPGIPSTVLIGQAGDNNQATATQALGTKAGNINIGQLNDGNVATVSQLEGVRNSATVLQSDNDNTAAITQTGTQDATIAPAPPSVVIVVQDGKSGNVSVNQGADGSNVIATQFNGNRNIQTITQADQGRALDIATYQGGDDNELTLNQSGQENTAAILQSNLLLPADPANGPSEHTATLTQGGTVNEAVIGQGGFTNTANMTQSGEENFASTLQYGSDNTATTNQTTTMRNNTANITQGRVSGGVAAARATRNATNVAVALLGLAPGDVIQSEDNTATVNQTAGENQVVNLFQSGDNETATISQSGSDNNNRTVQAGEMDMLTHNQTGSQGRIIASQYGEETDKGNTQTINQGGNNNTADVGQIKFGNQATVTQTGHDNNLLVGSTVRQIGENNVTTINQNGDRGNIALSQGNATGVTFGGQTLASTGYDPTTNDAFRNTAGITQAGLDNAIGVVQHGDDGTATVNQAGDNNTIGIRQLNPGPGLLDRSVFNIASATQTAGVATSLIDIEQFGRRNNGSATQSGTGVNNRITLLQRDDDNVAILSQTQGNQNVIEVVQNPDAGKLGGRVEIAQVGQDNKARLRQTGYENTLTLTQTGNRNVLQLNGGNPEALQGGHNNTATLLQTGEDHTINLNQSGMNNTIMVTQSNL